MWDVIVLGLGGAGSAALLHVAQRGARVLGLEQFHRGHDRGSSHGQTRVIRLAYFEHPDYVPLLREAYTLWDALAEHTGEMLFRRTGLLEVGPVDGVVVPGVRRSAELHGLPIEELTPAEARWRFPGFHVPEDFDVVFEPNAGYLLVERCVLAHLAQAEQHGAHVQTGEQVLEWRADGSGVAVATTSGTYRAAKLIVTAGPWAARMLTELQLPLRVLRKHLHWFRAEDDTYRVERGSPVFFYEVAGHYFYGFPQVDDRGVKLAEHSGGEEVAAPDKNLSHVDPDERGRVAEFLSRFMPRVRSTEPVDHAVCYYTMSPDENFYLDVHPRHPQVSLAAGLSGHGFKFTSVLGKVLAELALDGDTSLPIDFLRIARHRTNGPA